jgi:hypothetical protein
MRIEAAGEHILLVERDDDFHWLNHLVVSAA